MIDYLLNAVWLFLMWFVLLELLPEDAEGAVGTGPESGVQAAAGSDSDGGGVWVFGRAGDE